MVTTQQQVTPVIVDSVLKSVDEVISSGYKVRSSYKSIGHTVVIYESQFLGDCLLHVVDHVRLSTRFIHLSNMFKVTSFINSIRG